MAEQSADVQMDDAPCSRAVPDGYSEVREGAAAILQRANDVFFNPAQVINRDMSIAVLQFFVQQREEEIASGKLKLKRKHKGVAAAAAAAAPGANGCEGEGATPAAAAAEGGQQDQQQQQQQQQEQQDQQQQHEHKGAELEQPDAQAAEEAGSHGIRVLEGLAASGLRAIRYASEINGVSEVVANDLDPNVVAAMKQNIEWNGGVAAEKVKPSVGDARLVALQSPCGFDAVDLDPYGSPSQLLDSAVQAVSEGGLLLVTATDMATLCGNNGEACYAKYGCYPLHKPYCHEMALRILLASIQEHAARYKRYIVPVVSLSIDFYIRVFVRVYTSAHEVKSSAYKLGYLWQSMGCDSFYWQRVGRRSPKGSKGARGGKVQEGEGAADGNGEGGGEAAAAAAASASGGSVVYKYTPGHGPAVPQECPETGAAFAMGGPFWMEPIHDQEWVEGILRLIRSQKDRYPAYDKIHSILTAVSEELPDVPLYFDLHSICKTLHCTPPKADMLRSAIVNAGYRVSSSHACPLGVKTDAPWHVIWDIFRCWVQDHPTRPPTPGSSMEKILAKEPELKADFSRAQQALSKAKYRGVARFLPNPQANWGPKAKHARPMRGQQQQQHQADAAGAQAEPQQNHCGAAQQ